MPPPADLATDPRLAVFDAVEAAATAFARLAHRHLRPPRARRRRGATLRPGAGTPLWLALVARIRPRLGRRGAKALLARELGADPSRITEYFHRRSAMPDAERTLRLLSWLGRPHPSAAGRPPASLRIKQRSRSAGSARQRPGAP